MPIREKRNKSPHWLVSCDAGFDAEAAALQDQFKNIQRIMRTSRSDGEIPASIHHIVSYLKDNSPHPKLSDSDKANECAGAMLMLRPHDRLTPSKAVIKEELVRALQKFHVALEDVHEHLFKYLFSGSGYGHSKQAVAFRHEALQALDDPEFYRGVVTLRRNLQHVDAIPAETLDIKLDRQLRKRGRQLRAFEEIAKRESPDFDAARVFIDNGLGRGWVISNDCHIIPLFCGNKALSGTAGGIDMLFAPVNIAGYGYAVDFLRKNVNENGQRLLITSLNIDPRILSVLDRSPHGRGILANFRSIAQASNHDWFHHAIFPITEGSIFESVFSTPNAPFAFPKILKNAKDALSSLPTASEEAEQDRYDGTTRYEKLSVRANLETWQAAFAQNPALKQRLLKKTADYLTGILQLKRELIQAANEGPPEECALRLKEADNIASYLALIGMDRLHLVIAPHDEALSQPVTHRYGRSGIVPDATHPSIHALIAALELPPPKKGDLSHYLNGNGADLTRLRVIPVVAVHSIPLLYKLTGPQKVREIAEKYIRPKFQTQFAAADRYLSGLETGPVAAFQARLAMEGYSSAAFWAHDAAASEHFFSTTNPAATARGFNDFLYSHPDSSQEVDQRLRLARSRFAESVSRTRHSKKDSSSSEVESRSR